MSRTYTDVHAKAGATLGWKSPMQKTLKVRGRKKLEDAKMEDLHLSAELNVQTQGLRQAEANTKWASRRLFSQRHSWCWAPAVFVSTLNGCSFHTTWQERALERGTKRCAAWSDRMVSTAKPTHTIAVL